jgi:hypothetical protein
VGYLLGGDLENDPMDMPDFGLVTDDGAALMLDDFYATEIATRVSNPFTARNYVSLALPQDLQRFYNLLFPTESSDYYVQFLLYCYISLVQSTDIAEHVKRYDNRISYDLKELQSYFNFTRISAAYSNDPDFKLLVTGQIRNAPDTLGRYNKFIVRQVSNTSKLVIISATQQRYYKPGSMPSTSATDMEVQLELGNSGTITKPVAVGDTGLSLSITGPFQSLDVNFSTNPYKAWLFSAEAPFHFDFAAKIKQLENSYQQVEAMLNFRREDCTASYENMWHTHHNSVYRFVGLLMAYVERVNIVWQKLAA